MLDKFSKNEKNIVSRAYLDHNMYYKDGKYFGQTDFS